MRKKILWIMLIVLCVFPMHVFAIEETYNDKVAPITETKMENDKINLYFFKSNTCIVCKKEEEFLELVKEKYQDYVTVYTFETTDDEKNAEYLSKVKEAFGSNQTKTVPFTVIGEKHFDGFSTPIKAEIEDAIKEYIEIGEYSNKIEVPFLGKVDKTDVSIPLVAVIFGYIDGFNPCAMWILLFLINLLFTLENKKKSWILGFIFLSISGFVYFLSMLGINLILSVIAVDWIKIAIAIFILGTGIWNLTKYFKNRKQEAGCEVIDEKKRKKILTKIQTILKYKSFLLSCIGIAILAITVNLVELTCSLGFPMVFTELLALNNITGFARIFYLFLYIIFYMLDDIIIFTISMLTLQATGITNRYNQISKVISGVIMILMGMLLIIKPEWLMLNF